MSRTHKDISLRYIINNNTAFLNLCQVGLLKSFSEKDYYILNSTVTCNDRLKVTCSEGILTKYPGQVCPGFA